MRTENTPLDKIKEIASAQKGYFSTGATLDIKFRREMLRRLEQGLHAYEKALCDALWHDLHKSYEEAYLTEISIVYGEIRQHLRHLSRWARRRKSPTPLKLFPSKSYSVKEPLGNSLIIAPWNYPVQLLLNPLVGAISAGCTAMLKPSPYVPQVSQVLAQLISETFEEQYIAVAQGNREVNAALLEERWDLIFFTGSPDLGKKVMAAAAKNLTPVVLELGGKSPCIIDKGADIAVAAKRIAWGKSLNAGQTCIAPDYILIHPEVKGEFVQAFGNEIRSLHGADIKESGHYVRMVSDKAFDRVSSYLKDGKILYGGGIDAGERFIEPTLLEVTNTDAPVMQEEIFGPIFPVITIEGEFREEVIKFVNGREKPLAFYYFGREGDGWEYIRRTSSGGGCINDVIMHIANEGVPFGGVGNSGMGRYHGKDSFEAFSHTRTIISTGTWIDLPFRYMPYKMFSLVKRLL